MILDFSLPIHFLWALLPETIVAGTALAVMMIDAFRRTGAGGARGAAPRWLAWIALAGLLVAAIANGWLLGLEEESGAAMIALDRYRVFANFLFLGAAGLTICVAADYLEREGLQRAEFYVLLLFATVGMMVMAGTRDLIVIFLGFETMSIASYVLAGLNRRDPRSSEAALKYFLLGAFSSAFLLYGIALLYGAAGTTNLFFLRATEGAGGAGGAGGVLLAAGIVLLIVGFGFKVAAVPFHMWVPDVYEGAPTAVTAYMAAGVKAAGFAAFVRIFAEGLGNVQDEWQGWLRALAILTMIVPNLVALQQTNVKRMLAYSSVAHAGYLLVALVAGNRSGVAAFLFYLIAYTAMTMGAFAVVLTLAREGDRRMDLRDYAGLGWSQPLPAAALAIFLVSLAGFPPTGGFVAKVYVFRAALEAGFADLAIVLALTTVVSYWYYLRVIVEMYMRGDAAAAPAVAWGRPMRLALVTCVAVTLWTGILPARPLAWAEGSAASLVAGVGPGPAGAGGRAATPPAPSGEDGDTPPAAPARTAPETPRARSARPEIAR